MSDVGNDQSNVIITIINDEEAFLMHDVVYCVT